MATYLRPGISGAPISALSIAGGAFAEFDRTGEASLTTASDAVTATGTLAIAGAASVTEVDAISATGAVAIVGSGSVTDGDETLSGSAMLIISGSGVVTEDGDTLTTATGYLRPPNKIRLTAGGGSRLYLRAA